MNEDSDRIWNKLQEMDNKLDKIQGDTNTQTIILKEEHGDELLKLFQRAFGRSKNKMRIWYYAEEPRAVSQIAELSGLSESTIYNYTAEMRRNNMIFKEEHGRTASYQRSDISQGIGLEEYVRDYVDDL